MAAVVLRWAKIASTTGIYNYGWLDLGNYVLTLNFLTKQQKCSCTDFFFLFSPLKNE